MGELDQVSWHIISSEIVLLLMITLVTSTLTAILLALTVLADKTKAPWLRVLAGLLLVSALAAFGVAVSLAVQALGQLG